MRKKTGKLNVTPVYRWNPKPLPTSVRFNACTVAILKKLKAIGCFGLPVDAGKLSDRKIIEAILQTYLLDLLRGLVEDKKLSAEKLDNARSYEALCDIFLEAAGEDLRTAEEWEKISND